MNIGFDLDKIFIDYPPLIPPALIDKLYRKKTEGPLLYRIPSKPEQLFRKLTHYPLFRPPIRHNIEAIKQLPHSNKHRYYLISSRFGFLKDITQVLMKTNGFNTLFHQAFFNFDNKQPHFFKDEIIKKVNIHKYVDDDLFLLQYLAAKNSKTVFFWLNTKHEKKLKHNLFAITNIIKLFK